MTDEHTELCKQQHTRSSIERARYVARWPEYCIYCEGEGKMCYTYDPSPPGVSLSPGYMEDCDPCSECLGQGICPRCGKEVWDYEDWDYEDYSNDDPLTCPLCGWRESNPDCLPAEAECLCWVGWDRKEQEVPYGDLGC